MSVRILTSSSLLCVALAAPAMEQAVVGPRALGMGGTGVACSDDYTAQYYNPATFGFFAQGEGPEQTRSASDNQDLNRKDWGFGVDVEAGYRVGGDIIDLADTALKIDVDQIKTLSTVATTDTSAIQGLVKVARVLGEFNPEEDVVTAQFNGGAGLRVLNFGLGFRTYGEALGRITTLDRTNVGIALDAADPTATVFEQINQITPDGYNSASYTPSVFNQSQLDQLASALQSQANAVGAPITLAQAQDAANKLDYASAQAGVSADQAISATPILLQAISVAGSAASALSTSIENNQTAIRFSGIAVAEVPLTYGHAFDEHWSVGGSVKLMQGRVYGLDVQLINSGDEEFNDYFGDLQEGYRSTFNVGLDLGVQGRWDMIQVGLTGRNLNAPVFKGPEITVGTLGTIKYEDIRFGPEVAAGLAFIPWQYVTLAVDGDLTRNTTLRPDYDTQYVRGGVEFKAWHALALRGGVSKNIAESEVPFLVHGGVGLNLYVMRIDLAGAFSPETETLDGNEIPREARASLALATDW